MLKCIVRNDIIDETLRAVMTAGLSFDQVCDTLQLERREKKQLQMSICAMRNILEDKVVAPDCFTMNIDAASAERALQYLRQNPTTPREFFAISWTSTAFGHYLQNLWAKAKPTVEGMVADAIRCAEQNVGCDPPMTAAELEPVVELLAALDDGGDGFRYPSSLSGAWYVALPVLSLEAVGKLAEKLEWTCVAFETAREQCYEMATFGRPTPQYSGVDY